MALINRAAPSVNYSSTVDSSSEKTSVADTASSEANDFSNSYYQDAVERHPGADHRKLLGLEQNRFLGEAKGPMTTGLKNPLSQAHGLVDTSSLNPQDNSGLLDLESGMGKNPAGVATISGLDKSRNTGQTELDEGMGIFSDHNVSGQGLNDSTPGENLSNGFISELGDVTKSVAFATTLAGHGAPVGVTSASAIAASGTTSFALVNAGVVISAWAGAAFGTYLDKQITKKLGQSLGEWVYDKTHPEEQQASSGNSSAATNSTASTKNASNTTKKQQSSTTQTSSSDGKEGSSKTGQTKTTTAKTKAGKEKTTTLGGPDLDVPFSKQEAAAALARHGFTQESSASAPRTIGLSRPAPGDDSQGEDSGEDTNSVAEGLVLPASEFGADLQTGVKSQLKKKTAVLIDHAPDSGAKAPVGGNTGPNVAD